MSFKNVNYVATIKDVAKMAGVSISTVSRIINNKGGVSDDLDEKVKSAIEKLKYKPNIVARALKAKATKSIGLIVPSIENAIFPMLIRVIEEAAKRYGFSTILCNSEGNIEEEAKYLQLLVEKQVDGILFDAMGMYSKDFELLKHTNTPVLVLGDKIEGFEAANITIDNYKGAYMATKYLIDTGMRNIAFVFGQLEARSAINKRFEGYKAALGDSSIEYNEGLVVRSGWTFDGGIKAIEELLARNEKFDSIFTSNDMTALGCIDKLIDSGYRIPEDISVMGYDDIPVSSIIKPHLSTIRNPIKDFGVEAVKTILRIIYTGNNKNTGKVLDPEIIIRNSTR